MVRQQGFEQAVEFLGVVVVDKMAKFVEDHIVNQNLRKFHQADVEVDVVASGATSPVCTVVL